MASPYLSMCGVGHGGSVPFSTFDNVGGEGWDVTVIRFFCQLCVNLSMPPGRMVRYQVDQLSVGVYKRVLFQSFLRSGHTCCILS